MKPGIIIKLNRRGADSQFKSYTAEYLTEGGHLKPATETKSPSAWIALSSALRHFSSLGYCNPDWVIGTTKAVAKSFGLQHRLRAPGAGAPKKGDNKLVPLTIQITRATKIAIIAASVREGLTIGQAVTGRF